MDARPQTFKPVSWLEWRLSLGTALIDALKEALRLVEQASNPLPVIVVVSDGGENASGTSLARLVATRRQSETLIYGIHTDLPPSRYAPPVNRAFTRLPAGAGRRFGRHGLRGQERRSGRGRRAGVARRAALAVHAGLRARSVRPTASIGQLKVESTNRNVVLRHRAGYLAAVRR